MGMPVARAQGPRFGRSGPLLRPRQLTIGHTPGGTGKPLMRSSCKTLVVSGAGYGT